MSLPVYRFTEARTKERRTKSDVVALSLASAEKPETGGRTLVERINATENDLHDTPFLLGKIA